MPVHAHDEVTGEVHALDRDVRTRADGDPDCRARDRNTGTSFEHGVQIVGARIPAAGASKPETVAEQRADQWCVRRATPMESAPRAQFARQLVEALEPALRLHAGAVIRRQPECALGDITIPGGAFEHRLARFQALHGR